MKIMASYFARNRRSIPLPFSSNNEALILDDDVVCSDAAGRCLLRSYICVVITILLVSGNTIRRKITSHRFCIDERNFV